MGKSEITLYFRQGNGRGQKAILSQTDSTKFLYALAQQLFHIQQSSFTLVYHNKIIDSNHETLLKFLSIKQNSIIYVADNSQAHNSSMEATIFYMGKFYDFNGTEGSNIKQIKSFLCQKTETTGNIILTFMGRVLCEQETLKQLNLRNRDIISGVLVSNETNLNKLNPKNTESVTNDATETYSQKKHIHPSSILRKSSMKSSHQSKKTSGAYQKLEKVKRSSQIKSENGDQAQEKPVEKFEGLRFLNQPWLLNKKYIETESIHCDDSFEMDDPDFWNECYVTVKRDNSLYRLQCYQNTTWSDLLRKLSKLLFQEVDQKNIKSEENNLVQELIKSERILEVAKDRGQQSLPELTLNQPFFH